MTIEIPKIPVSVIVAEEPVSETNRFPVALPAGAIPVALPVGTLPVALDPATLPLPVEVANTVTVQASATLPVLRRNQTKPFITNTITLNPGAFGLAGQVDLEDHDYAYNFLRAYLTGLTAGAPFEVYLELSPDGMTWQQIALATSVSALGYNNSALYCLARHARIRVKNNGAASAQFTCIVGLHN